MGDALAAADDAPKEDPKEEPVGPFKLNLELRRDSLDCSWGYKWDKDHFDDGDLVLEKVAPDSILDKWNLKKRSLGEEEKCVRKGDRLVAVGEDTSKKAMLKALKALEEVSL